MDTATSVESSQRVFNVAKLPFIKMDTLKLVTATLFVRIRMRRILTMILNNIGTIRRINVTLKYCVRKYRTLWRTCCKHNTKFLDYNLSKIDYQDVPRYQTQ